MLTKLIRMALASSLALAGCCGTAQRAPLVTARPVAPAPCDRCGPAASVPPGAYSPVPVGPAVPVAPQGVAPQGQLPTQPIPAVPAQPGMVIAPHNDSAIVQGGYFAPAESGTIAPREPVVRLSAPEPINGPTTNTAADAAPASSAEPPLASIPSPQPAPPAVNRDAAPSLPDIPQFAMASPKVASGQQPFPDGVAWLREHGYTTVLHIHSAGADESAARRLFERYGLRYLSLITDATTLTKEDVDRFNRLVTDASNQPLFVYDKDSCIAGGLWYLHFRLVAGYADERARTEADRLGFHQDRDDTHRAMWLAVQKLLELNGR